MPRPVVVSKIEQDKLVVTQANRLIEASYTMTLEEKRVVLLMVSLVRKEDRDFHTYRIPITDIRDYLGLRTNKLYDDIKRVADILMSRVLHIPEEDGGWLKVGWVSSARYVPKGSKGAEVASLDLSFSPDMKPYLLELKAHFANYMLQNVAGLRSFYSIRLYELLKSRRRLASTTLDVGALRKIFKAEGKYANYKDFRARVVLPAQAELRDKTDLAFDFTEARKGRKVVSVTFHIRDNVPAKPPRSATGTARVTLPLPNVTQPPLLPPTEADTERARLMSEAMAEGGQNGVRESVMRDLLATRDPRHVLENIELARKRHLTAKGRDGGNLAGLTVAAISNDYAADDRSERIRAGTRKEGRERARLVQERTEETKAAAQAAWKRDVKARLAALSATELDGLRRAFASEVAAGRHGELFAADFGLREWKATGAEGLFRIFAAGRLGVDSAGDYCRAEALKAEAG
jgi:hypothetical protein